MAHALPAPSRTAFAAALTALALAGCSSGGGSDTSGPAQSAAPAAPTTGTQPTGAQPTGVQPAPVSSGPTTPAITAPEGPAGVSRPGPDQCVDVPEAPDGVYPVFEAGTATVIRQGDRLTLVDYRAAPGWTAEIDRSDRDEVEVEFRRGAEELDLEVEIDGGRVTVEICADDD